MFLRRGTSLDDYQDSVRNEQVNLYLYLLGLIFVAVLAIAPVLWPALVRTPLRLAIIIANLVLTGVAWTTAKLGRLNLTRPLVSAGYWILITLVIWETGGLDSPWLMSQLVIVVFAGLMVGERSALVLAFLSIGADLLFYIVQNSDLGAGIDSILPVEFLASILINFLIVGGLILLTNNLMRLRSERASENELRYRSLFEKTNDAVFLIGLDNRQVKANERAARMLGYEPEELVGMHIDQIVAPEEREKAHAVADRLQREDMLPVYERTMVRKDGSRITVEINVAMITDQRGRPLHIQSVVRDVTERKRLEQQLRDNLAEMEDIAMQDPLTGLLNRRAIADHVDVEWHRSHRERQPMCVLLIDMDNLKEINDKYGHKMGDEALLQLADALRQSKRRYDWMGRWGGDEFLVVLPNTSLLQAKEVAERCRTVIETEPLKDPQGRAIQVEASIGLACYSGREGEEIPIDMLLAQADQALYRAKEGGRNKVAIYRD